MEKTVKKSVSQPDRMLRVTSGTIEVMERLRGLLVHRAIGKNRADEAAMIAGASANGLLVIILGIAWSELETARQN